MEEAIQYYLNSRAGFRECAKMFNCDRKKLSLEVNKLYPEHQKIKFINISKQVHGDRYDYSLVHNFKNYREKVTIICHKHGEFTQEVFTHTKGCNCRKCGFEVTALKKIQSTEEFLEKALAVHGSLYSYDKTVVVNNTTKVIITCNIHGDFEQIPDSHKSGKGCSICAKENIGWTKTKWRNKGRDRIAKMYIIKCFNEEEIFVKIGRTFNTVKRRFGSKHELPYNYEIIKTVESNDYDKIWEMEVALHRQYKEFKYVPKIHFEGNTECFSIEIIEKLEI